MKKLSIIALVLSTTLLTFSCKEKTKEAVTETKVVEVEKVVEKSNDFVKELKFKNFGYKVTATNSGSLNKLSIQPIGFEQNQEITQEIDGTVTGVDTEDLNGDGYPEILVYVTSAGSGSYGTVVCYSPNEGKSLSQVYFPETAGNKKLSKGYMGHDEFEVIEGTLAHRFPIYKDTDSNANPTGKTKQVQYELKNGENGRVFAIKKVIEY